MTNEDYIKNVSRLKEIAEAVKNPQFSLDKMDGIIEETRKIVAECTSYTRSLKEKVDSLDENFQEL